jgi:predicted metal-dependent hydrolase
MNQKSKLIIEDLEVDYEIVRRKVKYPRLEIKTDFLYIIVPEEFDDAHELVKKHESWIYKKLSRMKKSQQESKNLELNFKRDDKIFKEIVFSMVSDISIGLDVEVNRVKFRRMKSRWGSCSSKGNVNFNCYLKYLPENLIKYIVYHELTHLLEMGHNKKFWGIIAKRYPDYKEIEDELLIYWLKVKEHVGI